MIPYEHQVKASKLAVKIMKESMIVYLASEERSGKSLTTILTTEQLNIKTVLILTKKRAIDGWLNILKEYEHNKDYTVINYEQIKNYKPIYDLIVLDEAHNFISKFPIPSKTWNLVKQFTVNKPIILISATPHAQGYQLLYHQLALSSWSPWNKWPTAYLWFAKFGHIKFKWIYGKQIPDYTEVSPICFDSVKHLFIAETRVDLGFKHEPKDKIHYIELNQNTKDVYNNILKCRAIELNGWDLVCDTVMKLRTTLHTIEGGSVIQLIKKGKKIIKREGFVLSNTEKIDYIKSIWGDTDDMVIMYNYVSEKTKLESHFLQASILQSTSYAEGIDLYKFKHLIIYSQDFSTARHTQRRARQTNKLREEEIIVHYLLVKDAISDQVYEAVSINKKNYVDSLFKQVAL